MAQKAMLTLEGRQRDESGEETVTRLCTQADYSIRNGSHYILYEEKLPDSEAVVRNLIKLKGSLLEMTKRGPVSSRMVFEVGQSHRTEYVTPYGILPLEVCTQELEVLTRNPDDRAAEPKDRLTEAEATVPAQKDRLTEPEAAVMAQKDRLTEPDTAVMAQKNKSTETDTAVPAPGLEIRLAYRLASGEQFLSHCAISISLAPLHGAT